MFTWLIPDGSLPSDMGGEIPPHEAISFINPTKKVVEVLIDVYFVDRDPVRNLKIIIPAERSAHFGLGKIFEPGGELQQYGIGIAIPERTPFSLRVRSNVKLACQYTRVQTSKTAIGLMSVMPQAINEDENE